MATATPRSAPLRAAAGRSPKSKGVRSFARRSTGFCRVDPPALPKKHGASRAPFSISDALSGTFTLSSFKTDKPASASVKPRRKAWDFDIYVDTEQDEMSNLMEHSTCVLDISDDEAKVAQDERGKENIPPPDHTPNTAPAQTTSQISAAPETVDMVDRPRSPLGELDPKDFVPEGEDPSAVVEVPEDEEDDASQADTSSSGSLSKPPTVRKAGSSTEQPQLLRHAVMSSYLKANSSRAREGAKTPEKVLSDAVEPKSSESSPTTVDNTSGDTKVDQTPSEKPDDA